jgi:ATP-dependent DNA helicase DinG
MGQVIAIKDATRVSSGDSVLTFIDECYARLAALPSFIVRPGQKDLSYKICQSLVSGEPLAAEAPTGTGKTLAYLIGAIAANEKLRTLKDVPIVVATATVGLQSQILTGDLPRLVEAGIIHQGDALLAKGRGRYFCIKSAERQTDDGEASPQVDFFDAEANQESLVLEDIQQMLSAWQAHTWTGDFDSYSETPSPHIGKVAAASDTCVGHKCEHFSNCPFFVARRALSNAKIIIANHNLVLSDLSMVKDGVDPLFPFGKYLVVFDEAHHLPDKALEAGSAKLEFSTVLAELPRIIGFSKAWQKNSELSKLFAKHKLHSGDFEIGGLVNALTAAQAETEPLEPEAETGQYRFEQGVLPEGLASALSAAKVCADSLSQVMRDATQTLKQSTLAERTPALGPLQMELLYMAAGINSTVNGLGKALNLLLSSSRAVRWLFKNEINVEVHVSPLEGADVLKDLLWNSERVAVGMVSATLQDFEGFDRFKTRSGAPDYLKTMVLPHIFPYAENNMYLVDMQYSPQFETRQEFQTELLSVMPTFIDETEGTLVLFPSRTLMQRAMPELREKFGRIVLGQDDMGIKSLIQEHKDRIDAGKGSILCGLATLAEGLDLPGNYCTHVIICTVPFTVPTSPVERELQEVMGRDYFEKRALPDALMRITQMVGRLMRRESDRGRLTVFDKRLYYKKWGRQILHAIPRFKVQRVSPGHPLSDMQARYKLAPPPQLGLRSA